MTLNTLAESVRRLLTGEPLRAIGYGAIAVVFIVTRFGSIFGYPLPEADLNAIVLAVGAAVTAVTEFSRNFVYSPNTVSEIAAELGVDTATDVAESDVV